MILDRVSSRSDANPAGYRDLTPLAALHHLGELRLIDVREPEEFVGPLGHVPGAELVPLSTVSTVAGAWDRDAPLLLICRSGGRSARAATTLAVMGFRRLYNLTGGMLAWDANDLPRTVGHDAIGIVAGQLEACFVAMADGDADQGRHAYRAAVGVGLPTPADLRRALGALRPVGGVTAEDCAIWTRHLLQRLAEIGVKP